MYVGVGIIRMYCLFVISVIFIVVMFIVMGSLEELYPLGSGTVSIVGQEGEGKIEGIEGRGGRGGRGGMR